MNIIKKTLLKWGGWRFAEAFTKILNRIDEEKEIQRVAEMYRDFINYFDLVFDIGANTGRYTKAFCRLGADVIAVEPQPKLAEKLRKMVNMGRNVPIKVVQRGVANITGMQKFYICKDQPGISTFAVEHKKKFPEYKYVSGGEIKMITLDDLISEYGLPKYCKIDVEGFEYNVLLGLTKRIPCISIEVSKTPEETERCRKLLVGRGYKEFLLNGSKDIFFRL